VSLTTDLPSLDEWRIGSGGSRHRPLSSMYEVTESGCWLWVGQTSADGYGKVTVAKRSWRAHRLIYTIVRGGIPDGMQLDHLCRVRNCVNPDHLDPVDARTNLLRGETLAAANAAKESCKNGHPLAGDNLAVYADGQRRCRECARINNRARQQAKNEWARAKRAASC
jgi:hypothetical protein